MSAGDPTLSLLLAAASVSPADLEPALLGPLDWPRVLHLAAWHRLEPCLHRALTPHHAAVPAAVLDRLEAAYRESQAQHLLHAARLAEVVATLDRAGIAVLLLKGAALVRSVHDDPAERPMSDLDLLVEAGRAEAAAGALATLGYAPRGYPSAAIAARMARDHHHLPVRVSGDGLTAVEIHTHVAATASGLAFPIERMWRGARRTDGLPAGSVPAPAAMLLHLCIHFFTDRQHSSVGALGQVRDIALVLARQADAIDLGAMACEAAADGLELPVYLGIACARELLGAPVAADAVAALDRDGKGRALLASFVARRVLRARTWLDLELLRPGSQPLGRLLPAPAYLAERYDRPRRPGALLPLYVARARAVGRVLLPALARPWEPLVEQWLNHRLQTVGRRRR